MYLLSYFTAASEALHLATSADGIHFEPVNGGDAVLRSQVGSRSIRDPFVGRAQDGVFHLLGTDGWKSTHIVHATSTDLTDWTEPVLLAVMTEIPGALNSWAPEFFFDPISETYTIIWSSVVDPSFPQIDGSWVDPTARQRIWACTTTDFRTLEPARVFFDPGYSVIDANVIADRGSFLMAFKDERGPNDLDGAHKRIHLARFTDPVGPISILPEPIPASPVEGPSLYRRDGELVLIFDRFLEGSYGAVSSEDGNTWHPTVIELPAGMRHGSVLAVAQDGPLQAIAVTRSPPIDAAALQRD